MNDDVKGLTVVFTGSGKGKTSAAMGMVFRALGHGFKCKVIQFIKGSMDTGELHLAKKLAPDLEIVRVGKGFTWLKDHSRDEHVAATQEGIEAAWKDMDSGRYDLMVLDEILYALNKGLVTLEQLLEFVDRKPENMHLVLTGRGAPDELVEKADMVTTMEATKHPFQQGIPAQKGSDF